MRVRTLEIRWHDSKPISTCDFQHVPFKKARPAFEKDFTSQSYKLATGGEDNHVRLWTVYPNILPPSVTESIPSTGSSSAVPHPPRVEYLATLSRHSAPVNVVRFSPNGDLIASAGDDGMIIIWAPSNTPQANSYGSETTTEEMQYEKEHWKARTTFRCTTMQVYDLAWSPTGEFVIAGSTDNTARVFSTSDGTCVHEIAEHSHYVQGVAWDPMNEFIATQSSDRSMHVYSITTKQGTFEAHAIGRNTRMPHHHSRTPSSSGRPRHTRRQSVTSDAESAISEQPRDDIALNAPLTPTTSIASTPAAMFPPPPVEKTSSRRSSFSGSNAPSSPSHYGRFGRSPSPMPPLPAIRALPSAAWASVKLYGDENFTNFFRRLTFSPDGGLLLTPAGQFEDPSVVPGRSSSSGSGSKSEEQQRRGRRGNPTDAEVDSASCVYIYTRANFARPPIAQLPGHKKASVAVKFSPILYELRSGVTGGDMHEMKQVAVERGKEESIALDLVGTREEMESPFTPIKQPIPVSTSAPSGSQTMPSPALSAVDSLRPPTPALSQPSTPIGPPTTGTIFALPYRMLFAVATKDTVTLHDTQQAGPVCMLTKLHYDEFTDMAWSPDGQCLMLSSRDGYCTLVVFDEILPTHTTQQHTLQLQSIANHHSLSTPHSHPTPASMSISLPTPSPISRKRSEPPLTPAASVVEENPMVGSTSDADAQEPPKKKRRVALTRVGDLDS